MDKIHDTLQRIEELWAEIQRAKPNTPEHVALKERIRVLSTEYTTLVDASQKRKSQEEPLPGSRDSA